MNDQQLVETKHIPVVFKVREREAEKRGCLRFKISKEQRAEEKFCPHTGPTFYIYILHSVLTQNIEASGRPLRGQCLEGFFGHSLGGEVSD